MPGPIFKNLVIPLLLVLSACSSHPPMETVEQVDLQRFMGNWYVIANIPTFLEKDAHNAIESYALNSDGTVATTFTFRDGAFDGPLKTYKPKGYVLDENSNALWGMQFIWPIKGDFRIVYLDESYQNTIIGRKARDYVWIMSRRPKVNPTEFEKLKSVVSDLGYDANKLKLVPQQWDESAKGGVL